MVTTPLDIGVIGTGAMGSRIAKRLIKAGHKVSVTDRTEDKARAVALEGATYKETVHDLVDSCRVVVTSLSDDTAVEDAYLRSDGIISALGGRHIAADMSSVRPETSAKLHDAARAKGAKMVDVGLSGSLRPLENGELIALVGGDEEAYWELMPAFDAICKETHYLGPSGSGEAMKLVANSILASAMAAVAEAIRLGEALGLSKDALATVLSGAAVMPPGLTGKLDKIRTGAYEPEFKISLMLKDLDNVIREASGMGLSMPLAGESRGLYAAASALDPDRDFSAVYEAIRAS